MKLPRSERSNGRSCRDPKDFLVRIRGAATGELDEVSLPGRLQARRPRRRRPVPQAVASTAAAQPAQPEIRAIAELVDGRVLSLQKRVRICR